MAKKTTSNFENFDNTIKQFAPEFSSIASMTMSGQLPNFAQEMMGEALSEGPTPNGMMPPVLQAILYGRKDDGKRK